MANVSDIQVTNVQQAGTDLIDNVTKMYNSLNSISDLIQGSSSCFDSDAGSQLRSKFASAAAEFATFRTFLNQYGEFLQTHASNVNAFEAAVQDGLSQIPQL